MKRGYILTAVSSAFLVLGGCSMEPDQAVNVTGLVLNHDSLEMVRGEVTRLTAVILPQSSSGEKVAWYTSDGSVAVVDENGTVTARALGDAEITAICHDIESVCRVSVVEAPDPVVGDWYYSDGTYSAELEADKTCIGRVFHVGQHENDKSDYSSTEIGSASCRGYVVAAADAVSEPCMWGGYGYMVGTFPVSGTGDRLDNFSDNGGDIDWSGYDYTEKLKAWSGASGTGGNVAESWPALAGVMAFEASCPAPQYSSGWFLPSISQLYEMYESTRRVDSEFFAPFAEDSWYWSSSELYMVPESSVVCVDTGYGAVGYRGKNENIALVRPVLAF